MPLTFVWIGLTALVASFLFTPLCRRLALRLGWVDHPNARKLHHVPMPLLGGLAIYGAAMLALVLFSIHLTTNELVGIACGASLVTFVGLLDDKGLLHHQVKLLIAMPLAAALLILSGMHLKVLVSLFGAQEEWLIADDILSLFWVVGITASFSIFDHMDGLCAGVAAIAAAFFVGLSILTGQMALGVLAAAVLGAALGFLRWNFNPAKIFMGDSGAMFLGFMMAVLGLVVRLPGRNEFEAWLAAILVLGVAIFDTILVTVSRTRRGLVPFASPGKDHTAHRLANLWSGQRAPVLFLYGLGVVCGLLALVVSLLLSPFDLIVFVFALVVMGIGVILLERAPYERQDRVLGAEKNPKTSSVPSVQ